MNNLFSNFEKLNDTFYIDGTQVRECWDYDNGNHSDILIGFIAETIPINETNDTITIAHVIWNKDTEAYDIDITNTSDIEYNGNSYPSKNGQAVIQKTQS
jgi:hypothetical protein